MQSRDYTPFTCYKERKSRDFSKLKYNSLHDPLVPFATNFPGRLRGLLGRGRTLSVLADISSIAELSTDILDIVPDLTGSGRSALSTNQRVDSSDQL